MKRIFPSLLANALLAASLTLLGAGCYYQRVGDAHSAHGDMVRINQLPAAHNADTSASYALVTYSGTTIGVIKMARNKNYCRPSQGGKSLEYAPVILPPNTNAPTEEEYNAAGWFYNAVQPPSPPEGKIVTDTTYVYDEEQNAIVAQYTYGDPPPPTLEEFDNAMEEYLKEERDARGYTTREPDSYLTSKVPRWAQDAKDWVNHRDDVMEYALELINAVEHGTRPPPTMAEFLEGMPKIEWTYQGL